MSKRRREDDEISDEYDEVNETGIESDYEPEEATTLKHDASIRRDRNDGQNNSNPAPYGNRLPQVDEEYGQRPMFDASRLKTYDSDQEVEDTDSVAAYLAQVNVERRALPQLVNSIDREAQLEVERAEGEDHRGRFVDGYYAVEPTSGPQRANNADEAYFDSIIAGYQSVRDIVTQPWQMDELAELSKYGYLSLRFEEPDCEHRVNLAKVILPLHTPQQIEIKYMEAQTAWYIITNVLKLLFSLGKGRPINNNVGTWIYFLLARIEPMQAQTADTISDLRELAQLLVEARDAVSEGKTQDRASEIPIEPSDPILANGTSTQQGYLETCQIVDTLLIIIGVYFRQRDLLELRRPLPELEPVQHTEEHNITENGNQVNQSESTTGEVTGSRDQPNILQHENADIDDGMTGSLSATGPIEGHSPACSKHEATGLHNYSESGNATGS